VGALLLVVVAHPHPSSTFVLRALISQLHA
jgi:hypothetical protein